MTTTPPSLPPAPGPDAAPPALPWRGLARPRNWAIALVLGLGWLVSWLPLRAMPAAGRPLGWLLGRIPRLARVTRANLAACRPDLDAAAQAALLRESLRQMAASVLDGLKVWMRFRRGHPGFAAAVRYAGLGHLEAALATGRPILLLTCHMNSTELNAAFGAGLPRGDRRYVAVYRRPSNRVADAVLHWARAKYLDRILPGTEVREIVKEIRGGALTWFAPDLEFHARGFVWAPFFGMPAATSNSVARFAGMTGAVVLPTRLMRDGPGRFVYEVMAPLEGFPTSDAATDAARVNAAIEAMIAGAPAEYWWGLERFLHRPEGAPPIY